MTLYFNSLLKLEFKLYQQIPNWFYIQIKYYKMKIGKFIND